MLKDTLLAVVVVTVAFFNTIDVELLLADGGSLRERFRVSEVVGIACWGSESKFHGCGKTG